MALQQIGRKSGVAIAVVGLGLFVVGCSARETVSSGAPFSVACEPNQRAVVRQVAVNGSLQSQVQCESAFAAAGTTSGYGVAAPVAYAQAPTAQPISYLVPSSAPVSGFVGAPIDNTRLVRVAYPQETVTREAAPQRVVSYQRAPERVIARQPKRSVKKSAVIIGSSAGVGAGLGAVIGGKKGAGIGALLGGGGAAVWDQITRRQK